MIFRPTIDFPVMALLLLTGVATLTQPAQAQEEPKAEPSAKRPEAEWSTKALCAETLSEKGLRHPGCFEVEFQGGVRHYLHSLRSSPNPEGSGGEDPGFVGTQIREAFRLHVGYRLGNASFVFMNYSRQRTDIGVALFDTEFDGPEHDAHDRLGIMSELKRRPWASSRRISFVLVCRAECTVGSRPTTGSSSASPIKASMERPPSTLSAEWR